MTEPRKSTWDRFKSRLHREPQAPQGNRKQGQKLPEVVSTDAPGPATHTGDAVTAPTSEPTSQNVAVEPSTPSRVAVQAVSVSNPDYSKNKTMLWDEAYESVRQESPDMIQAYEKFLNDPAEGLVVQDASRGDAETRQQRMNTLLQQSLDRTARVDKVEGQIVAALDIVLSVKDVIGTAVSSVPIAAAAWTPICISLQMFSRTLTEGQENLTGIVEIVKKMKWYSTLSLLLLEDTSSQDERYRELLPQLADRIRDLYKLLLAYIIKTICLHHHNRVFRALRGTMSDWKGAMTLINDAERRVTAFAQQYRSQQTNTYLQLLLNRHVDDTQRKILAALYVRNMDDEMKSLEHRKDRLIPGAYEWIIDRDEYKMFIDWAPENKCQVLWIKGDAGMGKTMIMIGMVRELNEHFNLPCLCYFFCQRTDEKLNTAISILKGLMWMLLCQERSLIRHLESEIRRSGDRFLSDNAAFPTLARIFKAMLNDKTLERAILAVDALDECKDRGELDAQSGQAGLEQLLELVRESIDETNNVKWLVSGRNIDVLSQALSPQVAEDDVQSASSMLKQKYLSIVICPDSVAKALQSYIDRKVDILRRKYLGKPRDKATRSELDAFQKQAGILDEVAKAVAQKTDGTFLWVALVFRELEECEPPTMLQRVEEMPKELMKLYARIFQRIRHSRFQESYKRVLLVMYNARRPLHVAELMVLANATRTTNDEDFLENTGLLTVRDDTTYFLHQSTREYLAERSDANIEQLFPNGMVPGHAQIVTRSLKAMEADLPDKTYKTQVASLPVAQVPQSSPDQLQAIRYSCVYWIDHFNDMPMHSRNKATYDEIYNFLRANLLEWLIAVSLMRQIPKCIESIGQLRDLCDGANVDYGVDIEHPSRLFDFIQQVYRFVHLHKEGIEHFPLQVYSTLLFTPIRSSIRTLLKDHEPDLFTAAPSVDDYWDTCLQTYTTLGNVVACSFTNGTLASATGTVINVINISSGSRSKTFETNAWVSALEYSLDGKWLAAGIGQATVEIWDLGEGVRCRTIDIAKEYQKETVWVACLEFSPTQPTIAFDLRSFGGGQSVWISHILDDPLMAKLFENNDRRGAIFRFLRDGKSIAICSEDIKIWNTETAKFTRTLPYRVGYLDFSPNGEQLAFIRIVTGDVEIRDLRSSEIVWTIRRPGISPVRWQCVCFSPDGQRVAIASDDCTVQLWNIAKNECLQTLSGHYDAVRWLSVSPQADQIMSLYRGGTVKLWRISAHPSNLVTDTRGDDTHRCSVDGITIAPDGSWFVSRSVSNVKIWDKNGVCLHTLDSVRSDLPIAISPTSRNFASTIKRRHSAGETSVGGVVRVWDKSSGNCVGVFKYEDREVGSVAFSPGGDLIAIGTLRNAEVYHVENKTRLHRFEWGGQENVRPALVAFSPDGRLLATGEDQWSSGIDKHALNVKIWELAHGTCGQQFKCSSRGFAQSLAFSNDGKSLLARADTFGTATVLNTETGDCLHKFSFFGIRNLAFVEGGPLMSSDRGTFRAKDAKSDNVLNDEDVCWEGPGVSEDKSWITWDGQNLLWLPPIYRPTCSAVRDRTVILGCSSGRVLVLPFNPDFQPISQVKSVKSTSS